MSTLPSCACLRRPSPDRLRHAGQWHACSPMAEKRVLALRVVRFTPSGDAGGVTC